MNECSTVVDPKFAANSVMYLPADFHEPAALTALQKQCKFEVKHLPTVIHHPGEVDADSLNPPGVLYLENKYVVPGGRFNEMYGWDSYFIIRGLVRDGRLDLARGMVENFFFEIEHYGNVLNANRSYYLSRSQPPFLTSMILSVYDSEKAAGHEDKNWLARAYAFAVKDHDMWTQEPHLAGSTGLSRYFDRGNGPSPESVKDETGHYRDVAAFFLQHPELDDHYLVRKEPGKTEPTDLRRPISRARLRLRPRRFAPSRASGGRTRRLRNRRRHRSQRGFLQRRPLHARIRLRHFVPLWPLRRRNSKLRPGMPE